MASESISFNTENGETTAYVARPDDPGGRAIIVVQEYWGLNANIKGIADRYAAEGFVAIAPDLYRGKVATTAAEAGGLMRALPVSDGIDTIKSAVAAGANSYDLSHFGITGFCMGGTFALRAACELEGFSAAAPFYGDIPEEDILKTLTVPTIFISATKDGWINAQKVAYLEDVVERYELPVNSVKYHADHAFFNDTRKDVYDAAAASDAWAMVIGFFNDKL